MAVQSNGSLELEGRKLTSKNYLLNFNFKKMSESIYVPTMAEMMAKGEQPEVLFWVGCSGSFDDRAKKITKAFVRILNKANVKFAVLGTEEGCTGDPSKT